MDVDKLKQNLETQLMELDILESMFYKPGELKIDDQSVLNEIKKYIKGETIILPPHLDITLNITTDEAKLEVSVNLSHEYPDVEPDLYVRNHKMNRTQHTKLNKDLADYISNHKGEQCIFTAITWLQDNLREYFDVDTKVEERVIEVKEKCEKLVRYWIYSHHIYSQTKRKEMLSLSNTLNITGFCMAGKPGIVCVEGCKDDCDEWWQAIKSMNWKKIVCKVTEDCNDRKFGEFREVSFPTHGVRGNHMDMSELFRYLETHNCGYIFKHLFGVDNRCNT